MNFVAVSSLVLELLKKCRVQKRVGHSVLEYADDNALIVKNETEIRQHFVEMENIARKLGLQINQEKTKYMIVKRKNSLKQNKIGHLKIKKNTNLKDLKISNI